MAHRRGLHGDREVDRPLINSSVCTLVPPQLLDRVEASRHLQPTIDRFTTKCTADCHCSAIGDKLEEELGFFVQPALGQQLFGGRKKTWRNMVKKGVLQNAL